MSSTLVNSHIELVNIAVTYNWQEVVVVDMATNKLFLLISNSLYHKLSKNIE